MSRTHTSRKLLLSLLLSSTFTAHAGMTTYNNPASLGFQLTGGWFSAFTQDQGFGIARADSDNVASGTYVKVDPEYKFGGSAGLFYGIENSPYIIGLNYWYYRSNQSAAAGGGVASVGITNIPNDFTIDDADAASSEINFKNDILNLSLGATYRPDCYFSITPQVGVTYLHVRNNQNITYFVDDLDSATDVLDLNSKFNGVGPSLGAELDYKLMRYFSLFGNFTFSALVGNITSSYNLARFAPDVDLADEASAFANLKSKKTLVGLFQTEIGFSYDFCPRYDGQIMIGYAVTKATGTSENNLYYAGDSSDNIFLDTFSDVGFQGPFARLAMAFDF